MAQCLQLTAEQLAAYLGMGYTLVSGPHGTQAECEERCNQPTTCCGCDVSPLQWEIYLTQGAGNDNLLCTNCHRYYLIHVLSAINVNDCVWTSPVVSEADVGCNNVGFPLWKLLCVSDAEGNPSYWSLRAIGTIATPGDTLVEYRLAADVWECMVQNTMYLVPQPPVSALTNCINWPATVSIAPR